jgi:hypothetical protein
VQEVSFDYDDGAGLRTAINGVQPSPYPGQGGLPYQPGFSFLNGTTLAGIDVSTSTTLSTTGVERGRVTLRGPLSSFVVAGLELMIDDISVIVPEPNAALLVGAGIVGMNALRRRRGRRY